MKFINMQVITLARTIVPLVFAKLVITLTMASRQPVFQVFLRMKGL